jgi:plasmid stabilization system protein ParE
MLNRRPALGYVRRDLAPDREAIEFWPVGRHLIDYRERKKGIEVVRIVGGERDLRSILS